MKDVESVMEVIERAPAAVCTTVNADGYPESRALLNLANRSLYPTISGFSGRTKEGLGLYFTTNTSSSKMRQFAANPRVSLYYCLAAEFRGVWVSGDMETVTDIDLKRRLWIDGWEMYYPGGYADPDFTILFLRAKRARAYRNLGVVELKGSDFAREA